MLFPPKKYVSLFMESYAYGEFYCLPLFCMEYAALGYGDNRPICLLKAFLLDRLVCSDSNKHSCLRARASSLHLRGSWKTPQAAESDHE